MKTTTNHGFKKPDGTDIVNIEDLNYNADKLDGLLVPATTTANGLMSKTDKAKLDGVAAGANNYTHPATHPASMISGLQKVATSGSYNDLLNKPSTFPPATHTHDDRYYTETEINTKLNEKANTSHTHTKSQITDFPTSLPANGGTASVAHTAYQIAVPPANYDTVPLEIGRYIDFHVGGSSRDYDGRLQLQDGSLVFVSPTNSAYTMNIPSEINSLKSSVVNGKQEVANAINDKSGSSFNNTSPFADMAWWIRNKIQTPPMPLSTYSTASVYLPRQNDFYVCTQIPYYQNSVLTLPTATLLQWVDASASLGLYIQSTATFYILNADTKWITVTNGSRYYTSLKNISMIYNPNKVEIQISGTNGNASGGRVFAMHKVLFD